MLSRISKYFTPTLLQIRHQTEARMSTGDPSYHQVAEAAPAAGQEGAVAPAEGQEQAQPQPSVFETLKSMAVRIMIFYFIMNFFKKTPQQPSAGSGADGVSRTKGPAANLFSEGMGFDLYLYISEQEEFGQFNVMKPLAW